MFRSLVEKGRLAVRETRFIRVSLLLAVALNLLTWSLVLWFALPKAGADPVFALHYTVYFGVDHIGPAPRLLSAPFLGTVILLVNIPILARTYVGDRLAGAFFMGLTAVLETLLLVSSYLLILLNV